jgi:hypothetical protein
MCGSPPVNTLGLYQLLLCHCDKSSDKDNLGEEEFIVAHGFRGFSQAYRAWTEHYIMVAGVCDGGSLTEKRKQREREREREEGLRDLV